MKINLKSSFVALAMILVGLATVYTTSASAATVCFKYNMKVRVEQSVNSAKVQTLSTLKVAGPINNGWMSVKGGWVKLGPPNQVPCGASTNSLSREPQVTAFKTPKVVRDALEGIAGILRQYGRDVKKGKEALAQISIVEFCEKRRSDFGWTKCFALSRKLEVHASRLIATNTNAEARMRARSYVLNFLSKDLMSQTHKRLDKVIDADLAEIPAGRWNSKRVKSLESLAERLADSTRVADFERFVSKTHPKLQSASSLLKQQHPVFVVQVAKVRTELAPPQLTKKQEDLAKNGVDPRVFVANEVFLAVDPSVRFNKRTSEVESALPMDVVKFDETITGLAGVGHDAVFAALKNGSEMTVNSYAKAHDELKPYAEDAGNYLAQRDAGVKSPVTCNSRKGKGLSDCQKAVEVLIQFNDVVKPSVAAAYASFQTLPLSSKTEELKVNVQIARDDFDEKYQSFSEKSLVAQAKAYVVSNLYAVIGAITVLFALIIAISRRRQGVYGHTSLGSGRF